MLKSTYKAVGPPSSSISSLPPGWSEHKAPSGHSYYYNAETKQSTYTKPTELAPAPVNTTYEAAADFSRPALIFPSWAESVDGHHAPSYTANGRGNFHGGRSYQDRFRRQPREDRPKHKASVSGCEPWLLVKTKLGRRFVHNPETGESFWKFPQDVMLAVLEMDRREREEKERRERGEREEEPEGPKNLNRPTAKKDALVHDSRPDDDSDSYEEVEVTDEEDGNDIEAQPKKQKTDQDEPGGPVEFDEEDIAFQLAQMGEEYGLDPEEYDEDNPDYDEGLPLTEAESTSLFRRLLDDFHINPYTTWEKIIEDSHIVEDDRYAALPNTAARKKAFSEWSRDRIHDLQEQRRKEERKDPRIAYLRFLHEHATPKLYWPEFKRKFKKEPEMKDTKLAEKEKEKLYRDHVARLRLSESSKKSDLSALLKELPITVLNRDSPLENLPGALLTNLKYITLPAGTRDPLIEAYIATLPSAPDASSNTELSAEEQEALQKKREEQRKREAALADRERRVQEEKRKQRGALRYGKEMLRDEEAELGRAMRVRKDGLRAYMEEGEGEEQEERVVGAGAGAEAGD